MTGGLELQGWSQADAPARSSPQRPVLKAFPKKRAYKVCVGVCVCVSGNDVTKPGKEAVEVDYCLLYDCMIHL